MEANAGRKPAQASASRAADVRFLRDSEALSPHLAQKQTARGASCPRLASQWDEI